MQVSFYAKTLPAAKEALGKIVEQLKTQVPDLVVDTETKTTATHAYCILKHKLTKK